MMPADFIKMLKYAVPDEIAEIRRLLSVPADHPLPPGLMFVGPGQDNYGRGHGDTTSRLAELIRKARPPEPEPEPEPEALDGRNPVKRESV